MPAIDPLRPVLMGPYRVQPSIQPAPPAEPVAKPLSGDTLDLSTKPEPKGFAIQSLKYDDLVSGQSRELVFEKDRGSLLPPASQPWMDPIKDPRTGQPHLALREMRMRVSVGRYDVVMKVDGDGTPSFSKLYVDGRSVTGLAADALKAKIKEDPAMWGTITAAAAAGVLAAGHAYAKKTGEPVDFDLGSVRLYKSETLQVKAKVRAELTGDDRFMRSGGGEIGATYTDGKLQAGAGLRYRPRTEAYELAAHLNYQVDKTSAFSAGARYDSKTKDRAVMLSYRSEF